MNIRAHTIQQLESEKYYLNFYSNLTETVPEKATRLLISNLDTMMCKDFITPLKQEITFDWIMNKINKEILFINLSNIFKNIIGRDTFNIYSTTYGIGVFLLYHKQKTEKIKKIEHFLNKKNIAYSVEYSEANWVYRFKISKSKNNLEKIKEMEDIDCSF